MPSRLTGPQKAAILLLSLGEDAAAEVLKNLSEDEIVSVSRHMARYQDFTPADVNRTVNEFYLVAERARLLPSRPETKVQFLRKVLGRALGEERAQAMVDGLVNTAAGPIERLKWHDPHTIAQFIGGEHPQVIAVILANLGDPGLAQAVVTELPDPLQHDVLTRMAKLRAVPDDVLKEVEQTLDEAMAAQPKGEVGSGPQRVAGVLGSGSKRMEQALMGHLQRQNPELARQIRGQMFPFEDFIKVDNYGIQRVLARTPGEDLVRALRLADDALRRHFLRNMAPESAQAMQQALDALQPTPVAVIEAAQKRICTVARELAEQGLLTVLDRNKKPPKPPQPREA
jgi:flagellar motor switch protein FliG